MKTGADAGVIKYTNTKIRETMSGNLKITAGCENLFLTDHKQFTGRINKRDYNAGMISRAVFYGVKMTRVIAAVIKAVVNWLIIIKNKHKMLN